MKQQTRKSIHPIIIYILSLNSIDEGWVSPPLETPLLELSPTTEEFIVNVSVEKDVFGIHNKVFCGLSKGVVALLEAEVEYGKGGHGWLVTTE